MTSSTPSALKLTQVTKRFGEKVAVDALSLDIAPGTFLGFLGRNGAGKSTTLKMATGLVDPTSGTIEVLGHDLRHSSLEARRLMGVMPEDMALLELLTGQQYLRFVGRMYGLDDGAIDRRGAELFDTLDLKPGPRTLVSDYSFGMKKKLALCAALIHGPKILFLDEPFEGIDAVTNRTIKDILQTLQSKGVTLVLTSHILEVVEKLCPLIAIIDEGKLKGYGTLEQIKQGADSLESLFVSLVGGQQKGSLSWL
ncbi:MAG: ABC transporter ATP-binding protein [Myxococcaceae bacterium]